MEDIFQKFIVEGDNLIIAKCTFHKQLATDKEQVKGGGMWEWDRENKTIMLYGDSHEFGSVGYEDVSACIKSGNVFWSYAGGRSIEGHTFYLNTGCEIIQMQQPTNMEKKYTVAGDSWKAYIAQFEKLNEFWNNLPDTTALWLAQQIDIFAKAYPAPQGIGWVKAETKPEHNVGVLVFIPGEDNHITSGMWDISNEWVLLDEYRTPEEEVTHWMPLPGLPDGVESNDLPDDIVQTIKKIAREEMGLDENQPQPVLPTFWDVAKAFKWAAEYRDEIGGQLTLYNDQWTIISEDEDGNENETQDLTFGNVAELYCLQNGFDKAEQPGREVVFAEWAMNEGWVCKKGVGWMKHSNETPYVLTTAELWEVFEREAKP